MNFSESSFPSYFNHQRTVRRVVLILLLLSSLFVGFNIQTVNAQTASIDEVEAPNIVRPGDTINVIIRGSYETDISMEIEANIASEHGAHGTESFSVDLEGGSEHTGTWSAGIPIEAYTPSEDEYIDGEYTWELTARLPLFASAMPFTVTIIRPDEEPYINILSRTTMVLEGEEYVERDYVYNGELLVIHLRIEYSFTEETIVHVLLKNSLQLYFPEVIPYGDEGWFEYWTMSMDGSGFLILGEGLGARAPLDWTGDWEWDFEVLEESGARDSESFTIQVLDHEEAWATIHDVRTSSRYVDPEERFEVLVWGLYIFPEGTSGGLTLEIVYDDGTAVEGGGERMIPIPEGEDRGPFSETFTLTAPSTEGRYNFIAKLRISDLLVDEVRFIADVSDRPREDYYCRIVGVRVNGEEPPRDVIYGESFRVDVDLEWNIDPGMYIYLRIYDWDGIVDIIGWTPFEVEVEGDDSGTLSCEINYTPPRNGPWILRATAMLREEFTEEGYEQIFIVNVVGAEEAAIGGISDWSITALTTTPVDPFIGTDITFNTIIHVRTDDPLPQQVEVLYSLDEVEMYRDWQIYEGGDFLNVPSPPWTPALGVHTISCEVDPDYIYDDENRANNIRELTFEVASIPPLPPSWEPPPDDETPEETFDFYVTASPTEQILASTITYTINVEHVSGPPLPVQLEIDDLPPSISYSIEPTSGNPSYSAKLTLTRTASMQSGTYPITIKGLGDGEERYKTVTVIIEKGEDYQLQGTPRSITALPGETVEYTVTASSETGYSQYVNLHISDLPKGVTSELKPQAEKPTFQSILYLTISETVKPGVYTFTVSGSGTKPHKVNLILVVKEKIGEASAEEKKRQESTFSYYLPLFYLIAIIAAIVAGVTWLIRRRRRQPSKPRTYCIECGREIPWGSEFCTKCGTQQEIK